PLQDFARSRARHRGMPPENVGEACSPLLDLFSRTWLIAQSLSRSRQARHHGSHRNARHLRDFLIEKSFDLAQYQRSWRLEPFWHLRRFSHYFGMFGLLLTRLQG